MSADEVKNEQTDPSSQATATAESDETKMQMEKYKNDYLYLRADFENYKKQTLKERSDLLKFGYERFAVELLSIIDNFERAMDMKVTAENFSTFTKGIELTSNELKSLLQKFKIEEVPSEGQPFNPSYHEALSAEESNKYPEGHILRVFKKPYSLHGKVIRPGQVVVTKAPQQS